MRFLLEISEVLASSTDIRDSLQRIAALAVPRLADACIIYQAKANGELYKAAMAHADARQAALAARILSRYPIVPEGHLQQTVRSDKAILLPDVTDKVLRQNVVDEEHLKETRKLGVRSAILVPLRARGRNFGTLVFLSTKSGRKFADADLTLAQLVAKRAAVALDNARLLEEERRGSQRLQFLAEATKALTASLDLRAILNTLLDLIVPQIADWSVINLVQHDGSYRLHALRHRDPSCAEIVSNLRGSRISLPDSNRGTPLALRTGKPQLYTSLSADDLLHMVGPKMLPVIERLGCSAAAFLPLRSHSGALGVLTLVWTGRHRDSAFNPAELPLFEELAARAASAIEHAQLYERQHRVADTLQRAFLPATFPSIPGIDFDAVYAAGHSESEIGGDWYDAFELFDGRVFVTVGDVAGRGLPAAITMGKMRQALRSFALDHNELGALLSAANNALRLESPQSMVTVVACLIDPQSQEISYAVAGHPYPLIRMPDGSISELTGDGMPLGIRANLKLTTRSVPFPVGAMLVCYTDGLTESTHDVVEGEQRLRDALNNDDVYDSDHPAEAIMNAVIPGDHNDDVAVLTIRMTRTFPGALKLELPAVPVTAQKIRHALRAFTRDVGASSEKEFEIQVAVGEAVNNVIEHAYGATAGDICLTAECKGSQLIIEVADRGNWRLPRDDHGGRGLQIIEKLCQGLTVHSSTGRSSVRLKFDLADQIALSPMNPQA